MTIVNCDGGRFGVWQTGTAARQVSCSYPEWRMEFQQTLPHLRKEDIPGAGFAITGYTVHTDLGGDAALARLRDSGQVIRQALDEFADNA